MSVPKPDARPPGLLFDDRPVMAVGVLAFGTGIPVLTGLYGPVSPGSALFWLGFVWFIALAAAIWGGNRWLLFRQRRHLDWFSVPWRKLVSLVSANVLFTAPLTIAALWAWYRAAGLPVDIRTIELVTLTNVLCVLFVTHAYETVFLIRERQGDMVRVERLERLRAQAELDGLKAQVDPHFLFNSLNTLGHLIRHDARVAREFCDTLAEVYRYLLASRNSDSVPLSQELEFVRMYHRLLALRFGDALQLDIEAGAFELRMPPMSLQTLLENAVKHNRVESGDRLVVTIAAAPGGVEVSNPVRPRSSARPSLGVGLRNLDERCRALGGQGITVDVSGDVFRVRVPGVTA
ncbi:MAG: histidine kinase [Burkholderiales bacterium]|nr:histidine kinase [Burkholderiales bacterium]